MFAHPSFPPPQVPALVIGAPAGAAAAAGIKIAVGGAEQLSAPMTALRATWEATSFQLERLQANPECVAEEEAGLAARTAPPLKLTYTPTAPKAMPPSPAAGAPKVCVLREEGSNGDREMVSAFSLAGFEVWRRGGEVVLFSSSGFPLTKPPLPRCGTRPCRTCARAG